MTYCRARLNAEKITTDFQAWPWLMRTPISGSTATFVNQLKPKPTSRPDTDSIIDIRLDCMIQQRPLIPSTQQRLQILRGSRFRIH